MFNNTEHTHHASKEKRCTWKVHHQKAKKISPYGLYSWVQNAGCCKHQRHQTQNISWKSDNHLCSEDLTKHSFHFLPKTKQMFGTTDWHDLKRQRKGKNTHQNEWGLGCWFALKETQQKRLFDTHQFCFSFSALLSLHFNEKFETKAN